MVGCREITGQNAVKYFVTSCYRMYTRMLHLARVLEVHTLGSDNVQIPIVRSSMASLFIKRVRTLIHMLICSKPNPVYVLAGPC